MRKDLTGATLSGLVPLGLLVFAPFQAAFAQGNAGGVQFIEPGQPVVVIHGTVEAAEHAHAAGRGGGGGGSTGNNLYSHGGSIQATPQIYLVVWGNQWNTNGDPSGEVALLQKFYGGAGGSSWLNSVTQYCQGAGTGIVSCPSGAIFAGNPANMFVEILNDTATAAPTHPTQSQLAAEAVRAAQNVLTTHSSLEGAQFVIATATQNSASGFGTQYCAWHSSTTSSLTGTISYTNLPYITDAGASCGANFNGLGATAGITIVGGHEMAEAITDPFPSSGWLDSKGAENGDKCAWISSGQGASANTTLSTGIFPVQSLWSNGSGGCVLKY